MGLEAGTYIDDLNPDWPLSTDKRRQGDDHLRLIKQCIKNTFPNIDGECEATTAQMNLLVTLEALLAAKEPPGSIKMWDIVNKPTIPDGWVICNGQNVSGYGDVPDMRDRFILGRGTTYPTAGATGGAATDTSSSNGAHAHTGNTGAHALTTAQMPVHSHTMATQTFVDEIDNGTGKTYIVSGAGMSTGSAGSGDSHQHTISSDGDHTHTVDIIPPYYVTVFIVKVE